MSQEEHDPFHDIEAEAMAEDRKTFSEKAIDYAMNPRNAGSMEDTDAFASVTGSCGDTMEVWLKVDDGQIVHATFWTDGCGPSIACGSMATELVKRRTLRDALGIEASDILEALGGLPDSHIHCSLLASKTLTKAILRYINSHQGEPITEDTKRGGA